MIKTNIIRAPFVLLFLFYFTVLSGIAAPVFSQPALMQPWWHSLEQGRNKFRSGDYGGALMSFEDARRQRRVMYEQMERDFINFLSIGEVRRLGDSLDIIERFAYDRYYYAVTAALEELYYRIPKSSLINSAAAALNALGRLKDYPEAEYWIGEIYRIEGELTLALSQFHKAYALRNLFETPGFDIELLYKIAGIQLTVQNYTEMEKILLSIISDFDTLWSNAGSAELRRVSSDPRAISYAEASASFAAQAMTRTLDNDGIERFLELYRYNNRTVDKAHRLLGFFYAATGRSPAQQHLMFAFLIQNTIMLEEIIRREFDYTFTNLINLSEEIVKNPLLSSYAHEVEYYKTAYYLASSLYRNGKTSVANNLWTFLAACPEAGEWQSRAAVQLRSPRLEPLVEMP
jgi:hypothetical protein